jgi:hypothetical protein
MEPVFEFRDLMTADDQEWKLQVPDDNVHWSITLTMDDDVHTSASTIFPTGQSAGWYEIYSKTAFKHALAKGKTIRVEVDGEWVDTKKSRCHQTIIKGEFDVPETFSTMGAPVFNVFLPHRMLLSVHVAIVDGILKAIYAAVRAPLDDNPFDENIV